MLSLIPDEIHLPSESVSDPIAVWDKANAVNNLWTFIVYIEWLWQQEHAFEFYDRLMIERGEELRHCIQNLRDVSEKQGRVETSADSSV